LNFTGKAERAFTRSRELSASRLVMNLQVPLCRGHHRQLHQAGNEVAWWDKVKIDALRLTWQFWEQTHPNEVSTSID